jgi:hypothetical protein
LVLCFVEVCYSIIMQHIVYSANGIKVTRGDKSGAAFEHLKGARALVRIIVEHQIVLPSPLMLGLLFEAFIYILVLATISIRSAAEATAMVEDADLAFRFLKDHEIPLPGVLFACESDLFTCIPYATLSARMMQCSSTVGTASSNRKESSLPRTLAHTMQKELAHGSHQHKTGSYIYSLALSVLNSAQAGRRSHDLQITASLVAGTVDLDKLARVLSEPISDATGATTFCWPLAIIGTTAHKASHQHAIRKYLQTMYKRYRFGNILQALHLLEVLWFSSRTDESGPDILLDTMETLQSHVMLV